MAAVSSTPQAQVRAMRWWDIAPVHAIEVLAFPDTAWSPENFWGELAGVPETRSYWVAEVETGVAGYVGLMAVAHEADIQTIAVAPEHRGSGLGDALLGRALTEAADRRCSQVMLEVAADNNDAHRLYERHGFTAIAKRSNYYGRGRDALVMRVRLRSGGRDA